jgi:hypothetical protein
MSKEEEMETAMKVTNKMLTDMINAAPIQDETKKEILKNLPLVVDGLTEKLRSIYDPTKIWLEALQFAKYVDECAEHLEDIEINPFEHDEDCLINIANTLNRMATAFMGLAESSLQVLDDMNIKTNIYDFTDVVVEVEGAKNATQQ